MDIRGAIKSILKRLEALEEAVEAGAEVLNPNTNQVNPTTGITTGAGGGTKFKVLELPCGTLLCENGELIWENEAKERTVVVNKKGETNLVPKEITSGSLSKAWQTNYIIDNFNQIGEAEKAKHMDGQLSINESGVREEGSFSKGWLSEGTNLLRLIERGNAQFTGLVGVTMNTRLNEGGGGAWTGEITFRIKHNGVTVTTLGPLNLHEAFEYQLSMKAAILVAPGDTIELTQTYKASPGKEPWLTSGGIKVNCLTVSP